MQCTVFHSGFKPFTSISKARTETQIWHSPCSPLDSGTCKHNCYRWVHLPEVHACYACVVCFYDFMCTDPSIHLDLTSSTTHLLNIAPFNTFSLTCTATVPQGVVSPKTFTWRRRRIGPSKRGFNDITENGDSILINSTNLNQPTSTSVLTVREIITGDYRYRCKVQLSELSLMIKTDKYPINVTGERCLLIC